MQVVQLLHPLARGPDIEVVETRLPERRALRGLSEQVGLPRIAGATLGQQGARCSLFQNLHDLGRSSDFRPAQEQVNMLGHHNIFNNDKPVALPRLFQNGKEAVAALGRTEPLAPPVTGTRDKVQVVRAVKTVEVVRHD